MDYKITGTHPKGRGYCNHMIRSNVDYYILKVRNWVGAFCKDCVNPNSLKGINIIHVPKDLVDGSIPIK